MKKTEPATAVNERSIINTYDQFKAAGGGVALTVSHGGIRHSFEDGYLVLRIVNGQSVATADKRRPATFIGVPQKWFSTFDFRALKHHEAMQRVAERAQAWIAQQGWYSGPWVRNRWRDYVPADINKRFPIRRRP